MTSVHYVLASRCRELAERLTRWRGAGGALAGHWLADKCEI